VSKEAIGGILTFVLGMTLFVWFIRAINKYIDTKRQLEMAKYREAQIELEKKSKEDPLDLVVDCVTGELLPPGTRGRADTEG